MFENMPWPCGPSSPAYRISGGRTEVLVLPEHSDDYYIVPEGITADDIHGVATPVCLLPGNADKDFVDFTLPMVEEIAARLTPWATWYCAPGWFGSADFCGTAWGKSEVAILKSVPSPRHAISTAYHEAWHLAEAIMSEEFKNRLYAVMASGPAWPGEYYPSPKERTARAFEDFSMSMVEGCSMVVGPTAPWEIQLFWSVFSGDFGRAVMAARATPEPVASPAPRKTAFRRIMELVG